MVREIYSFFCRGHIFFFGNLHGPKNLRPAAITIFVNMPGICVVLPYNIIQMRSRIVRSGMVSGIRLRLGEGLSGASQKGQTTIGLGGHGLWCQPIAERRRGGMGTHRASSHLRKKANLVGEIKSLNGVGETTAVWDVRSETSRRQGNVNMGDK